MGATNYSKNSVIQEDDTECKIIHIYIQKSKKKLIFCRKLLSWNLGLNVYMCLSEWRINKFIEELRYKNGL